MSLLVPLPAQAITSVAAFLIMREPLGWKGSAGVLVSLVGVVVSEDPYPSFLRG
jgi:drug/metabolite transporter (DMT)-like permease